MNLPAAHSLSKSEENASKKRDAILQAAYGAFSTYGFRRTSMGDIAEAAGISRPALYIQFENKPDIFCALVKKILKDSLSDVQIALSSNAPLPDRLLAGLEVGFIRFHREIGSTPHGEELFSTKTELAGDLGDQWLAAMQDQFTLALDINTESRSVCSKDAASLIMDTMLGMKQRGISVEEMQHRAKALITLVAGKPSS